MKVTAVWILSMFIATLCCPIFAADPDHYNWRERKLTIETYDFAHLGSQILAQAEQLATRIFATAGVDTRWTAGSLLDTVHLTSDFSAVSQHQCAATLPLAKVRVQLLLHAPNGFSYQALGYALPCSERGMQITLYTDRMKTVSYSTDAVFHRVLGYALAHEIGHVLLRSSEHGKSGLMKALWTKNDWQRAAMLTIPFTPNQARRIAVELQAIGE
jgi:hypothetical protein